MSLGQRPNSEPVGTRRRILEHARRAFDERGVATVAIREIARELDLSPGNVSYHFATKEALVAALIAEAHAENELLVATPAESLDFVRVDEIIRAIMRRDSENRWLMRDYVGLLATLPSLRSLHQQWQSAREARVDGVVARLVDSGALDGERIRSALPLLRQQLITQVFFWLPAAILAAPDRDPTERLDAHARAALALFRAYCTPRGRRQLDALLEAAPSPAPKRRGPKIAASRRSRGKRR